MTLPEGLEIISSYAFAKCKSLESIDFPSSLKAIRKSAFEATGVKEARLNEGLSYLGSRAFSYCPNLTTIYLPKSLRWISNANSSYDRVVAGDCDALEKIVVPEGFKPRMPTPWEVSSSSKGTKISSLFTGKKIKESVALQKELDAYPALQWVWLGSMSPKSAQQEFYNDTGFWF